MNEEETHDRRLLLFSAAAGVILPVFLLLFDRPVPAALAGATFATAILVILLTS